QGGCCCPRRTAILSGPRDRSGLGDDETERARCGQCSSEIRPQPQTAFLMAQRACLGDLFPWRLQQTRSCTENSENCKYCSSLFNYALRASSDLSPECVCLAR